MLAGQAAGPVSITSLTMNALPATTVNVNTLTNSYTIACLTLEQQASFNGILQQQSGVSKISTQFSFANAYHQTSLNNQTIINGGFNAIFDGVAITELGYFTYPENLIGTPAHNSSGRNVHRFISIYLLL